MRAVEQARASAKCQKLLAWIEFGCEKMRVLIIGGTGSEFLNFPFGERVSLCTVLDWVS
jgi:hypothetical protein